MPMPSVVEEVILASGARTATQTLGPFFNPDDSGQVEGIEVVLDLTAFTTAASLTLSIEEFVPNAATGAGNFRQVLAAVALTATGTTRLRYGPRFPETANQSRTGYVGTQYRVVVTHGNANSHTYSVTVKRVQGF